MAWGSRFRNDLVRGVARPAFILESVPVQGFKPYGGTLKYSSIPLDGYTSALSPQGASVSYGSLHPGQWSSTVGQMAIGIAGTDPRRETARGALVELRLGFEGYSAAEFERVFLGHVQSIDLVGQALWLITLREIVAGLTSRWTETGGAQPLFHTLPEPASRPTLTSAYTVADSTVTVTSTSGADRESGGNFLFGITNNAGEVFWLTASGATATSFTGVSASATLGTTAVSSSSGNTVVIPAYVQDHPLQVAGKIVASTGAATNGALDTLPQGWGLGIDRDYIDESDIDENTAISEPTAGSQVWDIYATEQVEDALGWIRSVLAPGAMFPAMRQGRITFRTGTIPNGKPPHVLSADDSDLVSIRRAETWSSRHPVEYNREAVTDSHGVSSTLTVDVDTRPTRNRIEHVLPFVTGTGTSRTAWREKIRDLQAAYNCQLPETVKITTAGWRLAELTLGDHLVLDTIHLLGRDADLPGPYRGGHLIVTSVQPQWFGATTEIEAVHVPDLPAS